MVDAGESRPVHGSVHGDNPRDGDPLEGLSEEHEGVHETPVPQEGQVDHTQLPHHIGPVSHVREEAANRGRDVILVLMMMMVVLMQLELCLYGVQQWRGLPNDRVVMVMVSAVAVQ